jgi:hypothetical protein
MFVETLVSVIASLSSIEDKEQFIENLLTLAQAHASVSDLQGYVETVQTVAVSGASVMTYLTGPNVENLISTIISAAGVYDYYKKISMAEAAITFYMAPRKDFIFSLPSPAFKMEKAI